MTALTTIHDDWQALVQRLQQCELGWQPTALIPVRVNIQQQRVDSAQALAFLMSVSGHHGWLQQPSAVLTLPAEQQDVARQLPLLAEGAVPGQSWRLQHLHGETWQQTRVAYECLPSCEGATHLAERVQHLSRKEPLHYLRLWALDAAGKPSLEMAILETFAGGKQ